MAEEIPVPDFGELLGPQLASLPQQALPALLCGLEREAARRYRAWAQALPQASRALLGCAAREERIACIVESLLPLADAHRAQVETALPGAIETYRKVFDGLPVRQQLYLQSRAELQGADAWRGIAAGVDDPRVREGLATCSVLEEESSRAVRALLESGGAKRLPDAPDAIAPDGMEVRELLRVEGGSLAHFRLAGGETSVAVAHHSVEELWYFVSGRGELWRKLGDDERTLGVEAGVCIALPVGTRFQLRALGDAPLEAVAVTLPAWPGDGEAYRVEGPWQSSRAGATRRAERAAIRTRP